MSICKTSRFVINKNQDNEFVFVIKKLGSVDAMPINADDIFEARIYKLDDGSIVGSVVTTIANLDGNILVAPVGLEGKIILKLSQVYCDALQTERGSKADRYYIKPTYRMVIECDTEANGKFTAKVPLIYVE